jgi:hypothetical protein
MDFGGLETGFSRIFYDFDGFLGSRGWILMDFGWAPGFWWSRDWIFTDFL